jgi:hypothetical protein
MAFAGYRYHQHIAGDEGYPSSRVKLCKRLAVFKVSPIDCQVLRFPAASLLWSTWTS